MDNFLPAKAYRQLLNLVNPTWDVTPTGPHPQGLFANAFDAPNAFGTPTKLQRAGNIFNTDAMKYMATNPSKMITNSPGVRNSQVRKALMDVMEENSKIMSKTKSRPWFSLAKDTRPSKLSVHPFGKSIYFKSDFHPMNIARATAINDIYNTKRLGALPYYLKSGLKNTAGALRWVVPSAMIGNKFIKDHIPGITDDKIFEGITKYGPETYLAAGGAAAIPEIATMLRTKKYLSDPVSKIGVNKALLKNIGKLGLGYGALVGMRKLMQDNDKEEEPIEKKSSILSTVADVIYPKLPYIIPATALGGLIGHLATKEEEIPATPSSFLSLVREKQRKNRENESKRSKWRKILSTPSWSQGPEANVAYGEQ